LRVYDNDLFFLLNDVGRQRSSIIVAGAFSHWMAEEKAGHRLVSPWVKGVKLKEELIRVGIIERSDTA